MLSLMQCAKATPISYIHTMLWLFYDHWNSILWDCTFKECVV